MHLVDFHSPSPKTFRPVLSTTISIDVARSLKSSDVLEWLGRVGVKTLFIQPGSPWQNGYIESFNGKLRDELLAREQVRYALRSQGTHRTLAATL